VSPLLDALVFPIIPEENFIVEHYLVTSEKGIVGVPGGKLRSAGLTEGKSAKETLYWHRKYRTLNHLPLHLHYSRHLFFRRLFTHWQFLVLGVDLMGHYLPT
jgi:hypothetical protein